ncbi:MAG: hypothetical protein R3245_02870 [Kiloniellales bacterium]|nr:hypothetical protein [Kiloniellales bacterium]
MAQSAPPSDAINKISISGTIRTAYAIVFGNLRDFFYAAALPILLTWVIGIFAATSQSFSSAAALFLLMVMLIPHVLFAVAWNRFVLLGPVEGAPPLFPRWQIRHWRYLSVFLRMLALQLLAGFFLSSIASGFVTWSNPDLGGAAIDPASITMDMVPAEAKLAMAVVMGVLFYIYFRMSFAFAAVSVDEEYGLTHSWRHSKGQGLRILATIALTSIPIGIVLFIVVWIIGTVFTPESTLQEASEQTIPWTLFVLELIVVKPLQFLLFALFITAIAEAFRQSTGWVPHKPPPPQVVNIEV